MKFLKQILITFFTAIMTVTLFYGGYTIFAAGEKKINFRAANNFYDAFDGYHGEMNAYFNDKISKMLVLIDSDGYYQDKEKKKKFLPPAGLSDSATTSEILKACGEDNFSSYCVGIGSLQIYSEYLTKLQSLKKTIDFNPWGQGSYFEGGVIATELLRKQYKKADTIDKESQDAKAVLEASVAAYNEFRMAYPMHKKYQEMLNKLTKYKLVLKDVRLRVAEFPVRFVDASTSQCQ